MEHKVSKESNLLEYEMAQNSAQHHDNLLWSVSTLTWGASSVLLGFVLNNLSNSQQGTILLLFCVLGSLIILCSWFFTLQFRSIRNQKYARCLELEPILGFNQHTNLKHKKGSQTTLYSAVMALFLLTWAVMFIKVLMALLGYVFCLCCCCH